MSEIVDLSVASGPAAVVSGAKSMEDLAERADALARSAMRTPSLDVVRGFFNELGVLRIRRALHDAPDVLANALETQRSTAEAERVAREAYDAAALEGAWLIDEQFVTEGNKQFLLIGEGIEQQRKPMLAAEKAAYVAACVAKVPEVAKAAEVLRDAAYEHEVARNEVDLARTRLSVLKHEYDGLMVELQSLCLSIQVREMTK